MALQSVAIDKAPPRGDISNWDLGEVSFALKKIRALAGMGISQTDSIGAGDVQWIMSVFHDLAHEGIQLIEQSEKVYAAKESGAGEEGGK